MRVWAYCAKDWEKATRIAGGVKPLTSPPYSTLDIEWELDKATEADLIYLNLHGFRGQSRLYGQDGGAVWGTALTAEQISARRWDGIVVFMEVCFSAENGGSAIAQAFLRKGARAVIASETAAYGRVRFSLWDGEADRLMHFFRLTYGRTRDPHKALYMAKRFLRWLSYPLDADDRTTLKSFVCLTAEDIKPNGQ
jgi:hypothetical protein